MNNLDATLDKAQKIMNLQKKLNELYDLIALKFFMQFQDTISYHKLLTKFSASLIQKALDAGILYQPSSTVLKLL